MSRIRADKFVNSGATGAPQLTFGAEVVAGVGLTGAGGINITGVATAANFVGNVTGNTSGTAGGLTGTPDIAVRNITGVGATFTGVLTYEDVTNIDSVGIVTARTGIKVLAGGINAVGVVTATSFSGDGSNLSGVESGVANFVASGAIANGQTVVINTDGTVGIVTSSSSATPSIGSPVSFEKSNILYTSVVYDTLNNKVVIAYKDISNGGNGTAIVGTVEGSSITFGDSIVFADATTNYVSAVYDSTNNKVVIAYQDNGNSSYGTAIVGTVSGTSITFGTEVVFESANTQFIKSTYDSTNGKVVIAYHDQGNSSYGTAIVGTVSGTSISFGTAVVFESTTMGNHISSTYDSTNQRVVIAYLASNDGHAVVGTVSGTSISFGTPVTFDTDSSSSISAVYDSTNNRVVIFYNDAGNSYYGTAIVGTVSGTSISFGTAVAFNSYNTNPYATFNPSIGKIVVAYTQNSAPTITGVRIGTVSGTTISFGSAIVMYPVSFPGEMGTAYDPDTNQVVMAYFDYAYGNSGRCQIFSDKTVTTNLTTENYIGIAAEAISNGATGKINVVGGINSGQSGLTTSQTYFVARDGSINEYIDTTPPVVAGTSISNTKILIR